MIKFFTALFLITLFIFSQQIKAQSGWLLQTNPLPSGIGLGKIQFVSPSEGWISIGQGKLLHTTNAGTNWIVVTPFPNDTINSMADPANTMWWVNQTHGWKINWMGTNFNDAHGAVIHQTSDGGNSWQKKVLSTMVGDMGLQIQFVDINNGWAMVYNMSSGNASIFKSTNGGNNWTSIIQLSNKFAVFYFIDGNKGWMSRMTFINGNPSSPFEILNTVNSGANWSVQYSDNNSISNMVTAIQFTDQYNGWVVGSDARILKTTNGGTNWTQVSNAGITNVSQSKSVFFLDANTGWITNEEPSWPNHTILHTINGGNSWIHQDPNFLNGSMFNVFFWDSNNGWFTGERCVQNCNGPDSLMVFIGIIAHTTNGGIGIRQISSEIPSDYSLMQNYPNPFNPSTKIKFELPNPEYSGVKLIIYDILGREMETLVNEKLNAGVYETEWNASSYASGVYFYKIISGDYQETKKMILMK